jgi:hypothetical protein
MKPQEPVAVTPSYMPTVRHTALGSVATGLLALLLLLATAGCATRVATEPALVAGAHAQWATGEKVGPDIGVDVSAGKHEVTLALDPLRGVLDLISGTPSGADEAANAVTEGESLRGQLESRIAQEVAKGAEASQERIDALTTAVARLDEGLREQAESPPRPDLVIPPAPFGGGLIEWLLWAVGVVVAVVTWLQRRGVATTLRKAIEAAKGLIKEYDEAPYTAEDVAKIDAARNHEARRKAHQVP